MTQQEIINTIALTRLGYFGLAGLLDLYRRAESATEIVERRQHIRDILPDASDRLVDAFNNMDEALRLAEAEFEQDMALGIVPLTMADDRYPQRLRECADAPLMLYYKGSADLNQLRIVSIVGTRHTTAYGQDLVRKFMAELRQLCPNVLIVSGLAYGVDICAHRHALAQGYETVGVLAHGLDELYPTAHRQTAEEMLSHGGLLTEYMFQTRVDKSNFVRRNRIVAGMADAVVLVESATKGGGLITARIARDYDREVFAFPGSVGAKFSEGCHLLIKESTASLICSAADLVETMGWTTDAALSAAHEQGIEAQLFPELTEEEHKVVATLQRQNDLQVNILSVQSGIPIGRLSAILFSLEMKGVVRSMAGGNFHLNR
ncbi:MAG: DNA-processing protein DprA [Prevotella sp.]|nr:DNA-processing protein DprA [Prevotella sp.]